MTATLPYRPSRGDRFALWLFVVAGVAITVVTAVFAGIRIVELLSPGAKEVPVEFAGQTTTLETTTGGIDIALDSGTISVTELPTASLVAGVTQPIIVTLITGLIVACLITLTASILRGTIFSKRNTRLVSTAGLVGIIGLFLAQLNSTMLANGALAWATNREIDNVTFSSSPGFYVVGVFAVAVICTVFSIGERMQRDQEGLI